MKSATICGAFIMFRGSKLCELQNSYKDFLLRQRGGLWYNKSIFRAISGRMAIDTMIVIMVQ